jgi:outer membrane lipoprotein-sorting protein
VRFTGPEFTTKARLESGVISIEMSRDTGEGAGRLTLEFNADTGRLMRWIIIDAIGVKTTVSLQNPVYDVGLENKLFGVPSYEPENNN